MNSESKTEDKIHKSFCEFCPSMFFVVNYTTLKYEYIPLIRSITIWAQLQ
jgi:hypothetical protein